MIIRDEDDDDDDEDHDGEEDYDEDDVEDNVEPASKSSLQGSELIPYAWQQVHLQGLAEWHLMGGDDDDDGGDDDDDGGDDDDDGGDKNIVDNKKNLFGEHHSLPPHTFLLPEIV